MDIKNLSSNQKYKVAVLFIRYFVYIINVMVMSCSIGVYEIPLAAFEVPHYSQDDDQTREGIQQKGEAFNWENVLPKVPSLKTLSLLVVDSSCSVFEIMRLPQQLSDKRRHFKNKNEAFLNNELIYIRKAINGFENKMELRIDYSNKTLINTVQKRKYIHKPLKEYLIHKFYNGQEAYDQIIDYKDCIGLVSFDLFHKIRSADNNTAVKWLFSSNKFEINQPFQGLSHFS